MAPQRYFSATTTASSSNSAYDAGEEMANDEGSTSKPTQKKTKQLGPRPQTTLFISSLPFTATSTDLTTLFSDVGPLRRAFVVTDKETGKSKGVGYVTFAVHEDAQKALTEMQGHSLDGKRKMRLEWSTGKSADGVPVSVPPASTAAPASQRASRRREGTNAADERDPDAVRTIIVTGLSQCQPESDSKSIYKRARKIGDVDNVIYPAARFASSEVDNDIAHVVFRTPNHAMTAVEKLHAHTFKGAQLSVVLKKRADGAARLEAHMRPETKAKRDALKEKMAAAAAVADRMASQDKNTNASINRGSRLIIRNLPFDVTERDLRATFLPFGPIYSIDLPKKIARGASAAKDGDVVMDVDDVKNAKADSKADSLADVDEEEAEDREDDDDGDDDDEDTLEANGDADLASGRGRGFAFVWLVSRNDAAAAIKAVNGREIQHGAAEKAQLKVAKGKAGRLKAKEALELVSEIAQPARKVAVDWALSKKDWELKKDESEAEDTEAENEEEDEEEEEDSDLDPVEDDGDEDEEEDQDEKPTLPKPEEGTTLFIRNLPYQATEEELRTLFRSFGPLRYAKVTMDKATQKPKGTAFVCFWQAESADKALQQARLVEHESGSGSSRQTSGVKNPFSTPSILTADPSAPLTASLNLHGRVLSVVKAVDRTQADSLANAAQSAREKKDKRNTYLMREGVPMPNSPLASRLSEAEINRRLEAFQMRKAQMMKNPSLYMSKTRLSVRQLPLFVTEKVLKRLAEYAVKAFDEEVQAGQREGLSDAELAESRATGIAAAQAEEAAMPAEGRSKKQELKLKRLQALQRRRVTNKGGLVVMQAKVIRSKDRLDATTGEGRSQGYGFVEMATFADALKVVRMANGTKSLRPKMIKWYAEELGEMAKKMRAQRTKTTSDDDRARLERIERKKAQLDDGQVDADEEGTRGGLLVVEFSIENVVTVKRRSERLSSGRKKGAENGGGRDKADRDRSGSSTMTSLGKRSRSSSEGGSSARAKEDRRGPVKKKARNPSTWNQKTKRKVEKPNSNETPLGTRGKGGRS